MIEGIRIIVCGGRNYIDRERIFSVLDATHKATPIRHLWHGNARGADSIAGEWGQNQFGVSVHSTPAKWKKFGRKAGPIRNKHMLGQNPGLVIAFPGGNGTAHMVKIAKAAGVRVVEIDKEKNNDHVPLGA